MIAVGFFGKLPARGDFVRLGLPRDFVDAWDGWLQRVLPASRDILGEGWLPAWMEAPVWRFALPAGLCGSDAALGLFMPSVDRAGRHFPLTFAATGPVSFDPADAWLDRAERAGLAALEHDLAPDALPPLLEPPPSAEAGVRGADALWWTDGAPLVAPARRTTAAMPDANAFAAMLSDAVPVA